MHDETRYEYKGPILEMWTETMGKERTDLGDGAALALDGGRRESKALWAIVGDGRAADQRAHRAASGARVGEAH